VKINQNRNLRLEVVIKRLMMIIENLNYLLIAVEKIDEDLVIQMRIQVL